MARTVCNISIITPLPKTSSNPLYGYLNCDPRRSVLGLTRPWNAKNGVKSIKANKRDNLDHLQRPGLKIREATSVPIGLWDRFPTARTMQQMMDTMDRIMEDPATITTRYPSQLQNNGTGYARGRTPWDIKEVETAYMLRFDMPGMTKNDVKIWVEEKMLVIKAEKVPKAENGQENGGVVEDEGDWPAKSYGTYSSRIALPDNVEFEKIKAEVKDGVLYLTVPKPSFKNKVLNINVE